MRQKQILKQVQQRSHNMFKEIKTDLAPKAIGPYSQAIRSGNLIFCSGQIPLTPSGDLITKSLQAQTEQVLDNLTQVLRCENCDLKNVLKVTLFLTDMADFPVINQIYNRYFSSPYPARSTIQVTKLPLGAALELEAIARLDNNLV